MSSALPIGWVLRASTVGFAVGCRVLPRELQAEANVPSFGDLVKVPLPDGVAIFGLIYDVQVRDDAAVRQLILAGDLEAEIMRDQRENRLVPIELSVLVVGYQREGEPPVQGLPPQPPISLDSLTLCDEADIRLFTEQLDYMRLVLSAAQIPCDELLIANLRRAAQVRSPEARRPFLLNAGRELARLLSFDLVRLDGILRRIKP